jgi:hypothetical protein
MSSFESFRGGEVIAPFGGTEKMSALKRRRESLV